MCGFRCSRHETPRMTTELCVSPDPPQEPPFHLDGATSQCHTRTLTCARVCMHVDEGDTVQTDTHAENVGPTRAWHKERA
jgi:hypothetical protein